MITFMVCFGACFLAVLTVFVIHLIMDKGISEADKQDIVKRIVNECIKQHYKKHSCRENVIVPNSSSSTSTSSNITPICAKEKINNNLCMKVEEALNNARGINVPRDNQYDEHKT